MESETNIRARVTLLIISVTLVAAAAIMAVSYIAYNEMMDSERDRLRFLVDSQASLMESMILDEELSADHAREHRQAVITVFGEGQGFGDTGELVLGSRQGDMLEYVGVKRTPLAFSQNSEVPRSVRWGSDFSQAMQNALRGESGTMVGLDYRGRTVLAAYRPIPGSGLGLVAKEEMGELQAPYIYAGLLSVVALIAIAGLTVAMYQTLSVPFLDRERAQRDLRMTEQRLRLLMDNTADGILTISPDGLIQSINQAAQKMFGYTDHDVIGKNISMLMLPGDAAKHDAYVSKYLETGKGTIIGIGPRELLAVRKDGSEFPIDLAVNEVFDGGKRMFIGSIRDISDRIQRRERIARSQKIEAVGRLTSGFARDFNNLLTSILGNLQLIGEQEGLDHKTVKYVDTAKLAGRRGSAMVDRLLAFSSRTPMKPEEVDVAQSLQNIIDLVRPGMRTDAAITLETDDQPWFAEADPAQLETALLNIFMNAREALMPAGKIKAILRNRVLGPEEAQELGITLRDYLSVTIEDDGAGMPQEVLERVFQPFFTTKSSANNSGLGLSIVQGFAHQAGGAVRIDSTPDHGTTVELLIPRFDPHAVQDDQNAEIEPVDA